MNALSLREDLRDFRPRMLLEPRYRHFLYALFWPVYLLRYFLIENFHPAQVYHVIHCPLDDQIPFLEGFVIFYVVWYLLIVGMHLYTLLTDREAFIAYSRYMILSICISTTIFLCYPSCQQLRPETFPRENLLTDAVGLLYRMDTSTNVLPSEHVIGSMAVLAAAVNLKRRPRPLVLATLGLLCLLTSISTVFLKQHSALDVLAALPVCVFAYWLCFGRAKRKIS